MKWQGCHPYAPAAFNPKRHPSYPIMFEAELTTDATGVIKSMNVSSDLVGNWTHSAATNCVTAYSSDTLMFFMYFTVHFASDEVLTLLTLDKPMCPPRQIEYPGIYIRLLIPVNLRKFARVKHVLITLNLSKKSISCNMSSHWTITFYSFRILVKYLYPIAQSV